MRQLAADEQNEIFIVGKNSFQNQLMKSTIAGWSSKISCRIADSLLDIPANSPESLRLVFYDCLGEEMEDVERMLESEARHGLRCDYFGLFNVKKDTGMESTLLNKRVSGFLYENDGLASLKKMIEGFEKRAWVSRKGGAYRRTARREKPESGGKSIGGLTSREMEILYFITKGYSNGMIADTTYTSPHTVKTHIYNIFRKIKVANRMQAAQWALRHF